MSPPLFSDAPNRTLGEWVSDGATQTLKLPEGTRLASTLDIALVKALESPELTDQEKNVVKILGLHRGAANAVRSRKIALMLGIDDGSEKPRRWIAQVIETLVLLHHLPIGGSRIQPYGYFLIETQNDLDLAINARWKEIFAHMRYLRALTSKQDVARLFGQAQLELDRTEQTEDWASPASGGSQS